MGDLRKIIVIAVLGAMAVLAGCAQMDHKSEKDEKDDKITAVASFYAMYEFARQIAQDKADVELLVPANISPHDWDPAPKDIKAVQEADLFIYSSEHFETWVAHLKKSLQNHDVRFIHASEGIALSERNEAHGNDGQKYDPHVWLSPVLAQKQVENIAEAFMKRDPENEKFYAAQRDELIEQLQQLDEEYAIAFRDVKKRTFITQHAAFGYLAKEYDLVEVPIAGLSPSLEPSAAQLRELKEFAKENEISTIFYETLSNPKTAQTLANELDADVEVLSTLEGLTKEEQEKNLTYMDMMRRNLNTLSKSLK